MKRILLFYLSSILIPVFAISQTVTLDLNRSIDIASDTSLQAFRAKNLFMANYWEYRSFKVGRLPSLTLRTTPIQYRRDFTQMYDSENNIDVYRRQQSLHTYGNLSISQNLDLTGGTFFLDSELGYMRNFGENTYSQFNTVPVRVGYSQSLFGFKYKKAKQQLLYLMQEISESVIIHFFSLVMAQVEYSRTKENVPSSNTLYRIGKNRYKIASIFQSDLLTLKLKAMNAQNTLQNTENP